MLMQELWQNNLVFRHLKVSLFYHSFYLILFQGALPELRARVDESPLVSVQVAKNIKKAKKKIGEFTKKEVNYITNQSQIRTSSSEQSSTQEISANEVLLSVAIYDPCKPVKLDEFVVAGSQPLTVLKDSIYCLNDHVPVCSHSYFVHKPARREDTISNRVTSCLKISFMMIQETQETFGKTMFQDMLLNQQILTNSY